MAKPIDIAGEVSQMKFLDDRNRFSDTTGVFARLGEYRGDSMISAGGFSGTSQWERHPNGDEIVQIIKGATKVTLLTEDGPTTPKLYSLPGELVIRASSAPRITGAE